MASCYKRIRTKLFIAFETKFLIGLFDVLIWLCRKCVLLLFHSNESILIERIFFLLFLSLPVLIEQ